MKVILIENVKKHGKKGDVVNVADGYARNYLFPKNLAVEANTKNMEKLKKQQLEYDKQQQEQLEEAKKIAKELTQKPVVISTKAGEKNKLFGSVTSMEIASAIEEQLKIKIDKRKIEIDEPIKTLGTYNIKIKIHPQVHPEITLRVDVE